MMNKSVSLNICTRLVLRVSFFALICLNSASKLAFLRLNYPFSPLLDFWIFVFLFFSSFRMNYIQRDLERIENSFEWNEQKWMRFDETKKKEDKHLSISFALSLMTICYFGKIFIITLEWMQRQAAAALTTESSGWKKEEAATLTIKGIKKLTDIHSYIPGPYIFRHSMAV